MSSVQRVEVDAAVVGAGPAGVAAAARLRRRGVSSVLVVDRASCVGGVPSRYTSDGVATFLRPPIPRPIDGATYARLLASDLERSGAELHLESTVLSIDLKDRRLHVLSPDRGRYDVRAEAIVFACGAREKTAVEQGWVFGRRPARVYNSMQMLDLMRRGLKPHAARVVLIGSQPSAYAMAAKLAALGGSGRDCSMVDHAARPRTPLMLRLWFGRWSRPRRVRISSAVEVCGGAAVDAVAPMSGEGASIPAQYVLLPGDLVPNSELLALAGVPVGVPSWRVDPSARVDLAARGVFLCGNICGGEHGAHRAHAHGWWMAGAVARYLRMHRR